MYAFYFLWLICKRLLNIIDIDLNWSIFALVLLMILNPLLWFCDSQFWAYMRGIFIVTPTTFSATTTAYINTPNLPEPCSDVVVYYIYNSVKLSRLRWTSIVVVSLNYTDDRSSIILWIWHAYIPTTRALIIIPIYIYINTSRYICIY